jgi:hypothetical protein
MEKSENHRISSVSLCFDGAHIQTRRVIATSDDPKDMTHLTPKLQAIKLNVRLHVSASWNERGPLAAAVNPCGAWN